MPTTAARTTSSTLAIASVAVALLCTSCGSGGRPTASPGSSTTASTAASAVSVTPATAATAATAGAGSLAAQFEGITAPVAVGTSGQVTWDRVKAESDQPASVTAPTIAGFTPMGRPGGIPLGDGRLLVVGRNDGDAAIAAQYRRNPASQSPGLPAPEWIQEAQLPIRLFVYDPDGGDLQPISGIPAVHDYQTAVSEGAAPDAVLEVRVLPGGRLVAYSVGFMGAGYDIEREVYIAPIPPG